MQKHIYLYIHLEGLEKGYIEIFGQEEPIHNQDEDWIHIQASSKHLRHQIQEQKHMLELGYHPDGKLIPLDEDYIHLKDGIFRWSDSEQDYISVSVDS